MLYIFLKLFINVLIIGLFLYSKLLPYRQKLDTRYLARFNTIERLLVPPLNFLRKRIKPYQVGQGLSVDMSQFFLLVILLTINLIL